MIDYTYKDLYYQDSINKQLKIEVDNGTVITNEDIFAESMTLTESLCSDTNLSFGSCEASKFEIKIANQFYSMKGMWLTVSEVLDGHENEPFVFGKYKVESDRPTADRSFREIVAYDALYDIINADVTDVAEWYETLLPELDSTVTLKEFRDSFFAHFDIEQEEVELPNDDMIVEKTITAASLSGREVVTAICEINGCFGHIGRDNKFHYIFLPEISDGNAYALAVDDDTFLVTPSRNASTSAILGHAVLGDAILGDDSVPSKTAILGYATLGRAVLANEDEPPEEHDFGIGTPFTEGAKQATVIEKENWQAIDYEDYVTETISSLQIRDNTSEAGYTYDLGGGGNNYIIDGNFLIYGKDNEETHEIAKNIYEKISCVSYRPTDATLRGNPCFEVGDPIQLNSKYQVINTYIIKRTLSGIQALKDNYESTGDETYDNAYNSISYEVEQLRGISNTFERTVEQNTLEIKNLEGQVSTIDQTINSISFNVTGGLGGTASIVMKVGDEAITGDIDLSDVREAFADENSSIEIAAGVITFASNTIIVESDNFQLTAAGKITAKSGTIGGWYITSTRIKSSDSSDLYIGGSEPGLLLINEENKPFFDAEDGNGNTTFRIDRDGSASFNGIVTATSFTAKDKYYIYDSNNNSALIIDATLGNQSSLRIGSDISNLYLAPKSTVSTNCDIWIGEDGSLGVHCGTINASTATFEYLTVSTHGQITGDFTIIGTLNIGNSSSNYMYVNSTSFFYSNVTIQNSGESARLMVRSTKGEMRTAITSNNMGLYNYVQNSSGEDVGDWIIRRNHDSGYIYVGSSLVASTAAFYPESEEAYSLGEASYRWSTIYEDNTTISTSDGRIKTDIEEIDERYENLFMKLRPVNFMWKNFRETDNHDRVHCGLIAQEVEQSCKEVGLTSETFAALCHDDLEKAGYDGLTDRYGFAYSELHGLEIHMIQKTIDSVDDLKTKLSEAQQQITELEEKINSLKGVA